MNIGDRVMLYSPVKKVDASIHWYHNLTGVIVGEYTKWKEHEYYHWQVKLDISPFRNGEDTFWFDDIEVRTILEH